MATGVCIAAPSCGDRSGRQGARQDGFTLIEVMVVVGIMAIVLAIALPAFNDWRESSALQSAEETLMGHLKQARLMAVSDNRSVSVVFTGSGYTVDSGGANQQQYQLSDYSKSLSLSDTFAGNTLTFGSDGVSSVTSTSNDSVTISNTNGASRAITVNTVGRAYD